MALLVTETILTFECERDGCSCQSPHYGYVLHSSPTDDDIKTEIGRAAGLAKQVGWFVLSSEYSICPAHFQKTLDDIRRVRVVTQE